MQRLTLRWDLPLGEIRPWQIKFMLKYNLGWECVLAENKYSLLFFLCWDFLQTKFSWQWNLAFAEVLLGIKLSSSKLPCISFPEPRLVPNHGRSSTLNCLSSLTRVNLPWTRVTQIHLPTISNLSVRLIWSSIESLYREIHMGLTP